MFLIRGLPPNSKHFVVAVGINVQCTGASVPKHRGKSVRRACLLCRSACSKESTIGAQYITIGS
jgi:hypothetical protein